MLGVKLVRLLKHNSCWAVSTEPRGASRTTIFFVSPFVSIVTQLLTGMPIGGLCLAMV